MTTFEYIQNTCVNHFISVTDFLIVTLFLINYLRLNDKIKILYFYMNLPNSNTLVTLE
jgi:hypothetical protein